MQRGNAEQAALARKIEQGGRDELTPLSRAVRDRQAPEAAMATAEQVKQQAMASLTGYPSQFIRMLC